MKNTTEQTHMEEEYRALFDMSLDLICVTDLNTATFKKINPSFTRVLGYTEEEILGRSFLDFIHPDDIQSTLDLMERCLKDGRIVPHFDNRYRTKSGQYRWLNWSGRPSLTDGVYYSYARDVTERKRADELQKALVEGTASATGPDFFPSFAKALAQVFQSRYILVCEHLDFPATRVKTLAFWMHDHLAENVEYDMAGGPCEETALGEMTFYPEGLQELFPKDKDLIELNAHSYCGFPLFDSSGQLIGHLAIMDDRPMDQNLCDVPALQVFVSRVAVEMERKRVERALRRCEHIVSSSTDMLALLDSNCVYLATNESYRKAFGFELGEIIGKTAAEVFGQSFFESTIRPAAQRCLSGEQVNFRGWFEFPVYGSVYMDISYSPYYDRDNKIKGYVVNGRDITKYKHASDQLSEMNMALSNAMPGIARLDTEGRYLEVNDYYANVLGYKPTELIGGGWSPTVHPDDMSVALQAYEKMCGEGKSEFETRAIRKDGSLFYKALLMVRTNAPDGSMTGHHCFMRDITERKQAEEEIRRHQDKLAHISRLSTMGEMATGLAHEVNQPLAAITNYCTAGLQILDNEAETSSDRLRVFFEKLTEQSLRAGEIIRRLRGLVGKRTPVRVRTEITEPIHEVLRLLGSDMRQSEVHLVLKIDKDVPAVRVDEVQIQQVLVNLIRNAMDAMTHSECEQRTLTVSASQTDDDAVEIAIGDTGRGIPGEAADQVFDAFFSSKSEGMGMGLAISRSIIESHGGRMWMSPNPEQGVTFHFTLPLEKKGIIDD